MASILKVNTIQDATNSNTAMTFSSTGVISEPNRPCFHVTKSADQSISDASLTLVTFDEITDGGNSKRQINVGGGYANNKYTVTAQTTGIYFFYTNIFFQATDTIQDAYVYFRKNTIGEQIEWWYHKSGCQSWFIVERDTTNNIKHKSFWYKKLENNFS